MAKLGTAVGGGVTVVVTCALLSFIYTPEQIAELIGNTTSALSINNLNNMKPQFFMDNSDTYYQVDSSDGIGFGYDADNPQTQKPPPSANRSRKPASSSLNGTADYFQRTWAISKLFYTNEKLSYIRMGMEVASIIVVGLVWRFCFRSGPTSNEEKLKKDVSELQAQLSKLKKSGSTSIIPDKAVAGPQIEAAVVKFATTVINSLERKIIALDAKFAQCQRLFQILYQAITFLYQNVEFKNTNTNTNNNIIMLNALFVEASKGTSPMENELVNTSGNILKTKNFSQDSFSNTSSNSVHTVSINSSLDTSRNISDSSLMLSPIKKEPSSEMPGLIPESVGRIPLPSSSKTNVNEIQSVIEDPVVTVEVRASPARPEFRPRRKKSDTVQSNSSEATTPQILAENTIPANQVSSQVQEEQQDTIRQLQAKLLLTEEANAQLESSISELEAQIKSLTISHETEKTELQGQLSAAEKLSSNFETKLAAVQTDLQSNIDNLRGTTEQLQREKASNKLLQTQLEDLKNQLEQQEKNMKSKEAELEKQLSDLQEQYHHLQLEFSVAETQLTVLQGEHLSLQTEHNNQCAERIHTLELMVDIAKKENDTLQIQLASAASLTELEKLRAELEDAKVTAEMMEDKYEATKKELAESNDELSRIRLSSLGSVELQERQYQDTQHQNQIVTELLLKIQALENENFELRADAIDGVAHQEAETQTELDMDQVVVELQLAQAEIEDKTNYIQELEAQLNNTFQVEQLKNELESQIPQDLEESANTVVNSVTGHMDASTETQNNNESPTESPPETRTEKKTQQISLIPKRTPSVHDRLHQQSFEHHCPACEQAAQGVTPNVPHANHITPSPSRTRSLSTSSDGRKAKGKVGATASFAKVKPTKGTTSKTSNPGGSSPPPTPPRGRQPSRSLYPAPAYHPQSPPSANLVVSANEETPRIVPGAPVIEPYTTFKFQPASMNVRKSKKRSLSFTHHSIDFKARNE